MGSLHRIRANDSNGGVFLKAMYSRREETAFRNRHLARTDSEIPEEIQSKVPDQAQNNQ